MEVPAMTKVKQTNYKALRVIRSFFPLVAKVQDADKQMVVNVTRADVAKSNIKDHKTCALAVCCQRTFHADGVIIGLTTAYIIRGNTAYRFKLTGTISREITSFDRGAGYDEGEYLLVPPSPSARLGAVRQSGPSGRSNGKGPKYFRHITGRVRTTLQQI
jgi:hypothetical protein